VLVMAPAFAKDFNGPLARSTPRYLETKSQTKA
jgi:hypothetical protein